MMKALCGVEGQKFVISAYHMFSKSIKKVSPIFKTKTRIVLTSISKYMVTNNDCDTLWRPILHWEEVKTYNFKNATRISA